jgi:hypothetical protein
MLKILRESNNIFNDCHYSGSLIIVTSSSHLKQHHGHNNIMITIFFLDETIKVLCVFYYYKIPGQIQTTHFSKGFARCSPHNVLLGFLKLT